MTTRLIKPVVAVSFDDMEAYMQVPPPAMGEADYTIEELRSYLHANGIINGIDEEKLQEIVRGTSYNVRLTVAKGKPIQEGKDAYFEFKFKQEVDHSPKELEDGSVDYWNVSLIETVVKGQEIAHYHPPVQGEEGITVKGHHIAPKIRKELAPLRGKGFILSEDNTSYIAEVDGKVEMHRDRMTVLPVHEVIGDVDMISGNVNFAGDVIIHGNVCMGATIRATESVTIDGIMEGAYIEAGKDVIIKNGIKGAYEGKVVTRGNVLAKYMEYVTIEAEGDVSSDSMIDCQIKAKGKVKLTGRHGLILGGHITAISGIEAVNIGNETEVETFIGVGVQSETVYQMASLQSKIAQEEQEIAKINQAIKIFEEYEEAQGKNANEDPRRMQLLRARIQDTALASADRSKLQELNDEVVKGSRAIINISAGIYPGVVVRIDDIKTVIRQKEVYCKIVRREDHLVLERLSGSRQNL